MKRALILTLTLASSAPLALAGPGRDYAKVTDVRPVYETVAYQQPRQQCWQEAVHSAPRSHTAPILGAIIGGAIGNELGSGKRNKQVGAVVGAALGASVGNDIRNRHAAPATTHYAQRCQTVYDTQYRNEVVAYDVTYSYRGQLYSTRMSQHPGKQIPVNVRVEPARW